MLELHSHYKSFRKIHKEMKLTFQQKSSTSTDADTKMCEFKSTATGALNMEKEKLNKI